jgi:hypothetical protein
VSEQRASDHLTFLAGLVFVVSVAALVTLEVMGKPTTNLMALVSPVVAALFVAGHINRVTAKQNEHIQKIEHQTNGVLDQRIRDGVLAALNARGEHRTESG